MYPDGIGAKDITIQTSRTGDQPSARALQGNVTQRSKHSQKTDDLPEIDWRKVGKIHEPSSAIDEVIGKEV
jgi:uncharacterized FlaG/YvyC family protein